MQIINNPEALYRLGKLIKSENLEIRIPGILKKT